MLCCAFRVIQSLYLSEIVDSLQIKNEDPMKVSNFSRSSYGFDTPKSSPCNPSQALAGSFTLKEEGMLSNRKNVKAFLSLCLFYIRLIFIK